MNKFNCKSRFFALILISSSFYGCKKNIKYVPGYKLKEPAAEIKKTDSESDAQTEYFQKIEASSLHTTIKSLEEFKLGGNIGLTINIERTGDPDFYQFFICDISSSNCSPKPQTPGEFILSSHQYSTPPSGQVRVNVRACIRPEKAADLNRLCGPYSAADIKLGESTDQNLTDLLNKRNEINFQAKKDCSDFFDNAQFYYDILRNDPALTKSKFTETVKNQIDMGKSLTCELIYSTIYNDLEVKNQTENNASDDNSTMDNTDKASQEKGWTPKAITLVTLGSASALLGAGFVAKSMGYDITSAIAKAFRLTSENSMTNKDIEDHRKTIIRELEILTADKLSLSNSHTRDTLSKIKDLYEDQAINIEIYQASLNENLKRIADHLQHQN